MKNASDSSAGHHAGNIFKKMDEIKFEDTISHQCGFALMAKELLRSLWMRSVNFWVEK
jgi:hypothetical protein